MVKIQNLNFLNFLVKNKINLKQYISMLLLYMWVKFEVIWTSFTAKVLFSCKAIFSHECVLHIMIHHCTKEHLNLSITSITKTPYSTWMLSLKTRQVVPLAADPTPVTFTTEPLPIWEVYAIGECPRKPSTPCFIWHQRGQDGSSLCGFVWAIFAVQSSLCMTQPKSWVFKHKIGLGLFCDHLLKLLKSENDYKKIP